MRRLNIYTIATKITYDIWSDHLIFKKLNKCIKENVEEIQLQKVIFSPSLDEAIEKYKYYYGNIKVYPSNPISVVEKNIKTEIIKDGEWVYTLDGIKNLMSSEDFLHYCKQELGLGQQINNCIINN